MLGLGLGLSGLTEIAEVSGRSLGPKAQGKL
jgi:hypothetical protein